MWRLGGKHSDFAIDPAAGVRLAARRPPPAGRHDHASSTTATAVSRALSLDVDETARRVTLQPRLHASGAACFADQPGQRPGPPQRQRPRRLGRAALRLRVLARRRADLRRPARRPSYVSYRAYRVPWTATGAGHARASPPSGRHSHRRLRELERRHARVPLGRDDAAPARARCRPIGTVARTGFETGMRLSHPWVTALALHGIDAAGRTIGSTGLVSVWIGRPVRSTARPSSSPAPHRASERPPRKSSPRLGRSCFIADRDLERGEALAAELGAGASFTETDVTSEEGCDSAACTRRSSASARCAGSSTAPASRCPQRVLGRDGVHELDTFLRVLAVNLAGTFNMTRLAAAAMAEGEPDAGGERGVVVCTASVAAFDGQIGQAAYSASKGGVAAMTLAAGSRVRAPAESVSSRSRPGSLTRRCLPGCRSPRASRSARRCLSRRDSAVPMSTPRWSSISPRTRCSTATRSGSTARFGWRRARPRRPSIHAAAPPRSARRTPRRRTSSR